jgi:MFS family permease
MAVDQSYQKVTIWQYKEFTFLLAASLLLSIGNKIYELLLPLIMYDLSGGSSIVMTSMRTAELLPNLFFGIVVGIIVDRVNKKKWAMWMILVQAVVLLIMYGMFGAHLYKPIIFYLFGFILMTLNYGFFNTQVSLIKLSVPLPLLTSANAKFSFIETFVGIMGPVFLGVVLLFANKAQGLFITVILYVLAYFLIMNLTVNEPVKKGSKNSFWLDFKEGWDVFTKNKALKTMTLFILFINCTMIVVSNTVLIFGTADLRLSNSVLSIILATAGVGGLIASLTINRLRIRFKLGVLFGAAILGNSIAYVGFYLTNHLYLLALCLLLNGYSTTIYIICAYTFRHEQTPSAFMGRIGGLTGSLFRIGMPISMLLSGWLINWWGTSSIFISSAVFNVIIFLFYRRTLLWKLQ